MDGLVGSPRCLLLFGLSMEVTMSGRLVVHCAGKIGKVSGGFWKVLFPNSY